MSIEILEAPPGATLQDAGRPGLLAQSIPPSGPLDPPTHAAANRAVGNEARACAIEVPLGRLRVRALGEVLASIDGQAPVRLREGDELTVEPGSSAVRYLALAGGIDVPLVLGSRSTLLTARMGGLEGRPLRKGDRLPLGPTPALAPTLFLPPAPTLAPVPEEPCLLEALPGPHLARLSPPARAALFETEWVVSRLGDRVGVRLEGAKVPREGVDLAGPMPMVRGAVQLTTDGTPIVLGPDHPATGGYPVALVLTRAAQARFARMRPGKRVRFVALGG